MRLPYIVRWYYWRRVDNTNPSPQRIPMSEARDCLFRWAGWMLLSIWLHTAIELSSMLCFTWLGWDRKPAAVRSKQKPKEVDCSLKYLFVGIKISGEQFLRLRKSIYLCGDLWFTMPPARVVWWKGNQVRILDRPAAVSPVYVFDLLCHWGE